jgi:hypothetical protein
MKTNTVKNKSLKVKTNLQRALKIRKSISNVNQNVYYQHKNDSIEKTISGAEYKKALIINTLNRYTLR